MSNLPNEPLSSTIVRLVKILRMNGLSYRDIATQLDISVGSAHNYAKDVAVLPKKMQRDPFSVIKEVKEQAFSKEVPPKDMVKKAIAETEYWMQEHEEGTRWEGPLDVMSLDNLREEMAVPTGYHSPLTSTEWINYYVAESMFGKGDTLSPTQIVIDDFLNRHQRAIVKVFRNAGKSCLTEGRAAWTICENPNKSYAIQSREAGVSIRRVGAVRVMIMTNKKIIADYGYLPHQKEYQGVRKTWRQSEFTVKRNIIKHDPTLMALSWKDTKMLGGHIDGVFFDDMWSQRLQMFAERNKEKWFDWYDGTFQGCLNPNAWEHIICTPKAPNDPYYELEQRGTYAVYRQPAVWKFPTKFEYIKENDIITGVKILSDDWHISDNCNGRFDIAYWLMKKKNTDTLKWEQEFQVNPMPPKGIILDWDKLRFINDKQEFFDKVIEGSKYQKIIGAMDLAFGSSKRSDYTCLIILAIHGRKYYVLEGWIRRGASKRDKKDMIDRAKKIFPKLSIVYIEEVLQQTEDVKELRNMIDSVAILGIDTRHDTSGLKRYATGDLSGKQVRILTQLEDPLETESLIINKNMACYDEFEREFRRFPRGDHDDVLDAIGMALEKLARKKALVYGYSGK